MLSETIAHWDMPSPACLVSQSQAGAHIPGPGQDIGKALEHPVPGVTLLGTTWTVCNSWLFTLRARITQISEAVDGILPYS